MEKASDIYHREIEELFFGLDVKDKQKTIDIFGDALDDVFSGFFNSKYVQYFKTKPQDISIEKHMSKIPDGVDSFEQWLKSYLEKMSSRFTLEFQKLLPPNIGLIYFAQLLDNHDFDTYFNNVNHPKNTKSFLKSSLVQLFNEKTLKHFIQAMSCSSIGLSNSANSLNYLWIQSALFEDEDLHKVINEAKKLEAITKKAKSAGKKGRAKRYEIRDKIKIFALERKEEGNFPNPRQAAIKLCDEICDFAESLGKPFTDRFTAKDRIYDWFRGK